ncbi:MAG: ComF family protein [Roseburia sp.]|nr:ComF family protein [Roseburia sp.]
MKQNFMKKWKEMLFCIFFPRHCPLCDEVIEYGHDVCRACAKKVPYIKEPACKKCGKQLENERREYCGDCSGKQHHYIQGKAVFSYRGEMKLSMYRFKYSNKREYADFYVKEAASRYGAWLVRRGIEVIIPVPMYAKKRRIRGYNQAEVFAKRLGGETGILVDDKMIRRIKNTTPQKELNDRQRKDNLKGAFQVKPNIVKYSKILLVDDIYTTGATVDAIAELLIKAGVAEVYFMSICVGEGD